MQLTEILQGVKVGDGFSAGNLQVFPLIKEGEEKLDYALIDELLGSGEAEISEVTAGGSVPTAKVVNHSGRDAVILDGMELHGAKQNRMVDVTIIIEKHSEVIIPVTCVEQGRWRYRSGQFSSSERTVPSRLRMMKSRQYVEQLRQFGEAKVDQHAVWSSVASYLASSKTVSGTQAMDDVFAQRRVDTEKITASLGDIQADGAIVALNGKIVGMDLVGDRRLFRRLWTPLLRGYALDAVLEGGAAAAAAAKPLAREAVVEWFEALGTGAEVSAHKVPGSGKYHAVVSPQVMGGVVTHGSHVVHVGLAPRG
jgi:hypothetical protein